MLLAEDLLLLAYDDETGRRNGVSNLEYALAGAMLVELAELGRIDVIGENGDKHKARLKVLDSEPSGTPVTDQVLGKVAGMDGRKPKDVVYAISGKLIEPLLGALAARGILSKERGRILGIFPVTRWPAEDSSHEQEVRERLRAVLVDGAEPDERTGSLISLLTAIDAIPQVIDKSDRETAVRRAHEIADGSWAGQATRGDHGRGDGGDLRADRHGVRERVAPARADR